MVKAGTVFNGSISTTGDVRFWVSAPNAEQIVDLGIVDKSATFSFVAQQNGTYVMKFGDDLSNTITVTFSYTFKPSGLRLEFNSNKPALLADYGNHRCIRKHYINNYHTSKKIASSTRAIGT